MTCPSECLPISSAGLARALGVRSQSIYNLWQRSKRMKDPERRMPDPVWSCDHWPLWCWSHDLLPWVERTGRAVVEDPVAQRDKRAALADFLGSRGGW